MIMKKFILALLILLPLSAFASSDSINIDIPASYACGSQPILIQGTANVQGLRKVRVYLDNQVISDKFQHSNTWSAGTRTLGVGTHTIKAQVRRLILNWMITAQDEITFTINPCDTGTIDPATTTPPIIDPATTTPPVVDPATTTPPVVCDEGYTLIGDSCEQVIVQPGIIEVSNGSGSSGFASVCTYVFTYSKDCAYTEDDRIRFAFDENFRESILRPWRNIVFGVK